MDEKRSEVTRLLLAWSDGDRDAFDRLMVLLQDELQGMAHGRLLGERNDITLETLELVSELCLRLLDRDSVEWKNSAQFRGEASRIMRRVLVDHARRHKAGIRNVGVKPAPIDEVGDIPDRTAGRHEMIAAIDEGLDRLAKVHPRQAEALQMHYFGGLTCEQIGQNQGTSEATAKRDLRAGRAWLRQSMSLPERMTK